jgi:hypothetical protein
MLDNFFWRSTDKQATCKSRNNSFLALVYKIQNVQIYNPASSGGQGKYMKYVSFLWLQLETALSIFNISLSFLLKAFLEGINKTQETAFSAES